jgi:hypothetical protein
MKFACKIIFDIEADNLYWLLILLVTTSVSLVDETYYTARKI